MSGGSMQEVITKVAGFVDKSATGMGDHWLAVHFREGEVFAQSMHGGMRAEIDTKLNCGVNAAKLVKAMKAIRGEPRFKQTKSALLVSGENHKGSVAELDIIPASSAPEFHRPAGNTWTATTALEHVQRVVWCSSDDVSRSHLNGVQFDKDGMSATDGKALCKITGTDFVKLLGMPCRVRPEFLKGLPDTVWLSCDNGHLFIAEDDQGDVFRSCKLVDGDFPDTTPIVKPALKAPYCTVKRDDMVDLVKRAKISAPMVALEIRGSHIHLEADKSRSAETLFTFMDSVLIEKKDKKFPELTIGVDIRLLLPMLEGTTSSLITLRMSEPLDPIMVQDDNYLGLVMPYRM